MPAVRPPDDDLDPGSGRHHRSCAPARAALARTGELSRRIETHEAEDNERFGSLRDDISGVRTDVGEVRSEVRQVNNHVGDLRVVAAKTQADVENLDATLGEQRQIQHVRMVAEVETSKAVTIASIDDATDRKKTQRAFWLKVAAVILTLAGTALGMLIEHYR